MSVIIRLQGLSWSASAMDIRNFFKGLSIPPGGVHIIGGDRGDAFIAFSTDEDARRAMLMNNNKLNDAPIMLFLSSKTEMQNTILEAKERHSAPAPAIPAAAPAAPAQASVSSAPAFNQMSQQLPVNTQTQIPGLGMPQVQIPQISQLSQFLSGLLPNTNLTSSVVGKFLSQQQQQQQVQPQPLHQPQPQQPPIVPPQLSNQPQIKSPIQDTTNSPYQNPYEQALPGEYSVGGIPQAKLPPTPNYMNHYGQNENPEMLAHNINDRRNVIPPNTLPPNVIPTSKADPGIFHGQIMNDPRANPKPFQSPSDSQQSWSSERNELYGHADLNRQREQDTLAKSKGDLAQIPRNSRWSDQSDFNYSDRNWTANDNSQDNWNQNSMRNWNDDWNKQNASNSMYDQGNMWNQINNGNTFQNYDGKKWMPEYIGGQNFDKMKGFPEKNESIVPQVPTSTINHNEQRWSPQKHDRSRFDQLKDTPKSQERYIPPMSTSVPTSAYDPKSYSPKTTPAIINEPPNVPTTKTQMGIPPRQEAAPNKDILSEANTKPGIHDDDQEMEVDEFGRMRRKRPEETKAGGSPSNKDKRDSRERSRDRDRSRHHDSPRRDRDRDRDRRDRDRDRDRRDRDRRDRDRDRDRRYRDRDDERRDRRRDQDRRNSPGSSESNRRSRKRSLSPNSKMENESDKKLQQEKPGIKPEEGLPFGPNTKMLPPVVSNHSQTNIAAPVLKDHKDELMGNVNMKPPGPLPLFPVIPPRGSGAGILGAAPPGFLNTENKPNDVSQIKNNAQEPMRDSNTRHPDEFVSDEIMMAEADAIYQQQIEGGSQGFEPGHPPMDRGSHAIHDRGPRNYGGGNIMEGPRPPFRGPPDVRREGPMFNQHPHDRPGPSEFDRDPLIRGPPPPRGHLLDNPPDMYRMPMDPREPNERLDRRPDGLPPLLQEPLHQEPPMDVRHQDRQHTPEFDNRRDLSRDIPPHLREGPMDPRRPHENFREPGEMRGLPEHFRGPPDEFRGPHPDMSDRLMRPGPEDREFEFRHRDIPHERPMFERGGPHMEGPRPPFDSHTRPLLDERDLPMRPPFDHQRPLLDERGFPLDHPGPRDRPFPPDMRDRPPFDPDMHGSDAPGMERHHGERRRPLLEDPMHHDIRPPGQPGIMGPRPHDRPDFGEVHPEERSDFHQRGLPRDRPPRDVPDRIMVDRPSRDTPDRVIDRPLRDAPDRMMIDRPPRDGPDRMMVDRPPRDAPDRIMVDRPPRDGPERKVVDRDPEFIRRPLLNTPDIPRTVPPEHEEREGNSRRHERGRDNRDHSRFDSRENRISHGGTPSSRPEKRDDRQGKPPSLLDLKPPSNSRDDRDRGSSRRPSRFDQPRDEGSNRDKSDSRPHSSNKIEINKDKPVDNKESKGSEKEDQKGSSNHADGEYYVHISNMPLNSNHGDVKKLLKDCAIHRKGIKIINDIKGNRTGQAMVRFINQSSLDNARKLSGFMLEKKIVAVEEVKKEQFDAIIDSYEPGDEVVESDRERSKKIDMCNTLTATLMNLSGGNSNLSMPGAQNQIKSDSSDSFVVKVENLAGITSVNDVRNLFRDCDLVKRDDAVLLSGVVKGLRHCFVEFQNEKSVKTALRVRKIFRGNVITVSQSTKQEREEMKEQRSGKGTVVVSEKKTETVKPDTQVKHGNAVNNGNKEIVVNKNKDSASDSINKDNKSDKNKDDSISDKNKDDSIGDKNKDKVDNKTKGSELGKEYHCIRITNLPYNFNYHDFRRLLDGLFIAPRGIQVCHDALGQTLGEGCVELRDNIEAKKAMEKDGLILGRNKIRVEVITKQTLIDHMRHARQSLRPEVSSQPQVFFYVKATNLPTNASTGEIMNFFGGYNPAPESIRLNVGEILPNQNFSTALIGFKKRDDAERAVSHIHRKLLRGKPIDLEKVIL